MYLFGLILGHEPRLVERRRRGQQDGLDDGKFGDGATSTQYADESAGDTGSLLTAETPIEQIPVMHLSHGGGSDKNNNNGGRRARRRSRSQAPRRDRLSLWSRLMCQPEVFDPHVEASPLSYLMEVNGAMATAQLPERRQRDVSGHSRRNPSAAGASSDDEHHTHQHRPSHDIAIVLSAAASSSEVRVDDAPLSPLTAAAAAAAVATSLSDVTSFSKDETVTSSSSSDSSDSVSQDPSSPLDSVEEFLVEVEEVGEDEPLDDEPPALSVSMTGGEGDAVPHVTPPRRAFRVTDTRKCRCHPSRAVLNFNDSTLTANTSFATSCQPDSSSSGVGTMSQSGTTATTHSTNGVGRLISRQELAVRRTQRRQQTREAARRQREYKAAWAELVATQKARASHYAADVDLGKRGQGMLVNGAKGLVEEEEDVRVVAVPLTNEALESHREHVAAPSFELPADFLSRVGRLKEAAQINQAQQQQQQSPQATSDSEEQRSLSGASHTSGDSSSSNSLVVVEEEARISESTVPAMYGTMLRCKEASAAQSAAAAAAVTASRLGGPRTSVNGSSSSVGSQNGGEGLQRIPRGKYALGSRGYVEHVMFAQRRQQECALFTLLTEAHRQARAAHLRLSQLYYYYVLPILAQYQAPHEVEGLVTSLLQCGSGTLRVFHHNFCKTVPVGAFYDYMQGSYVAANLVQVQPVDYQFAQYRFENPWRELFHEIKSFLGMQMREDVSVATLSTFACSEDAEGDVDGFARPVLPGKGTVCVAATVLHSMELFERQRHTQMAIRDAEDWLAWYYYIFTPQLQSATTAEARYAVVQSLLPLPSSVAGGGVRPAPVPPHPLEKEYLPLLWSKACETTTREEVLAYRRALKLEAMEAATVALQARTNAAIKTLTAPAEKTEEPARISGPLTTAETSFGNSGSEVALEKSTTTTATTAATTTTEAETNALTVESVSTAEKAILPPVVVLPVLHAEEVEVPHAVAPALVLPPLFAEDYEPPVRLYSSHTSPTTARVDGYRGRIKNGFVVANVDDDDDLAEENIIIDSYKTAYLGEDGAKKAKAKRAVDVVPVLAARQPHTTTTTTTAAAAQPPSAATPLSPSVMTYLESRLAAGATHKLSRTQASLVASLAAPPKSSENGSSQTSATTVTTTTATAVAASGAAEVPVSVTRGKVPLLSAMVDIVALAALELATQSAAAQTPSMASTAAAEMSSIVVLTDDAATVDDVAGQLESRYGLTVLRLADAAAPRHPAFPSTGGSAAAAAAGKSKAKKAKAAEASADGSALSATAGAASVGTVVVVVASPAGFLAVDRRSAIWKFIGAVAVLSCQPASQATSLLAALEGTAADASCTPQALNAQRWACLGHVSKIAIVAQQQPWLAAPALDLLTTLSLEGGDALPASTTTSASNHTLAATRRPVTVHYTVAEGTQRFQFLFSLLKGLVPHRGVLVHVATRECATFLYDALYSLLDELPSYVQILSDYEGASAYTNMHTSADRQRLCAAFDQVVAGEGKEEKTAAVLISCYGLVPRRGSVFLQYDIIPDMANYNQFLAEVLTPGASTNDVEVRREKTTRQRKRSVSPTPVPAASRKATAAKDKEALKDADASHSDATRSRADGPVNYTHLLVLLRPNEVCGAVAHLRQDGAARYRLDYHELANRSSGRYLFVGEKLKSLNKKLFAIQNAAYYAYKATMRVYSTVGPRDVYDETKVNLAKVAEEFGYTEVPLLDLRLKDTVFRPKEDYYRAARQKQEAERRAYKKFAKDNIIGEVAEEHIPDVQ